MSFGLIFSHCFKSDNNIVNGMVFLGFSINVAAAALPIELHYLTANSVK
jgi:hypothetical protein